MRDLKKILGSKLASRTIFFSITGHIEFVFFPSVSLYLLANKQFEFDCNSNQCHFLIKC